MSLHFDFAIACDLKPDTPQQVIKTLAYMTRTEDYPFDSPPDHPFFEGDEWRETLRTEPDGTYCPGDLGRSFRRAYRYDRLGVHHYRYTLSFRCYMKDDEFYDMAWPLIDWLAQHSETEGYVGYIRETLDWQPTLLYFKHGTFYIHKVSETPTGSGDKPAW